MTPPIFDGHGSNQSAGSPPPTGTGGTEGDTPEALSYEEWVAFQQANPPHGDSVKHERKCATCEHPQGWHRHGRGSCIECGCPGFASWTEAERVAFLRRAQQEGRQ